MAGYGRTLRTGLGRGLTSRYLVFPSADNLRTSGRFTILVIILLLVGLYYALSRYFDVRFARTNPSSHSETIPKVILAWTPFFDDASYLPPSLQGLGCHVDTCITSHNRSRLNFSDAIVFHWRDLRVSDFPSTRRSNHQWVLLNYESPHHVSWNVLKPFISGFNLTVTYRLDSDIVAPYGRIRMRSRSQVDLGENIRKFASKKFVVWMVSHCRTPSKRERFVQTLKRHIPVDIYGSCGQLVAPCQRNASRIQCYNHFAQEYKFYLSFENSLCKDYVTEKLFLPMTVGLIPVVFSSANYSRILPPNSYIDALAFNTPKDLANYLWKVGTNFTLYRRHLEWREQYEIVHNEADFYWLCDLCRMLHTPQRHVITKYTFFEWWYDKAACRSWIGDLILNDTEVVTTSIP